MDMLITNLEFPNQSSIPAEDVSTEQTPQGNLFLDIISKLDSELTAQVNEKKPLLQTNLDKEAMLDLEMAPSDIQLDQAKIDKAQIDKSVTEQTTIDQATMDQVLQLINENNIAINNPLSMQMFSTQNNLQYQPSKEEINIQSEQVQGEQAFSDKILQKNSNFPLFKNVENKTELKASDDPIETPLLDKFIQQQLSHSNVEAEEVNPVLKTPSKMKMASIEEKNVIKPLESESIDPLSLTSFSEIKELDMQNNKYINALSQLGDFLNGQTTRQFQDSGSTSTNYAHQIDYSQSLRNTYRPEYDLKIELPLTTIDAAIKETYNANIKIYPPELGEVTAKLKIDNNNAELIILTESNAVKQIVEANLNQLRENFQQAEINLTQIQVESSQSEAKQQNNQNQSPSQEGENSIEEQEMSNILSSKESARERNALIDTYA